MSATITRTRLVEVAESILRAARALEVRVPDSVAAEVMEVAQTADRVTAAWWVDSAECGCLVGTLRHRKGFPEIIGDRHQDDEVLEAEDWIACAFPSRLIHAASPADGDTTTDYESVVTVVAA